MIKNNILVIVLVLVAAVYFLFLPYVRISFRLNTNIDVDTAAEIVMNCPLIINPVQEYKDNKTNIVGGSLILLPIKRGKINLQAAIRDTGDDCQIVIGYPALPLESY